MPNAAANLADSSPFPSELLKLHHATDRSQSQSPRSNPNPSPAPPFSPGPRHHFQPGSTPLKDGYFEMQLSKAFFEDNPKSITLNWIDFYRT